MAINLTHGLDLEGRVEKLAERFELKGRGRKTASIRHTLTALEESLASEPPDRAAIEAAWTFRSTVG